MMKQTYEWSQSFNLRHTLYIALTHYSLSHNHYKVLLQVLPVMLLSLLHFYVIYCFDLYLFNNCSFCLSKPFGLFAVDCFNKTVMCNCVCLYIHEKNSHIEFKLLEILKCREGESLSKSSFLTNCCVNPDISFSTAINANRWCSQGLD